MRSAAHSRGRRRSAFTAVELIVVSAFILTGILAVTNVIAWLVSI